jgi:hypothetical protein
MYRFLALPLAMTLLGFVLQSPVSGEIVASNLSQPLDGYVFVKDAQWRAVSFTVGPASYTLDQVNIDAKADGSDWDGNGFAVSIYSDAAGPGAPLEILTGSTPTASGGIYPYYSSGLALTANDTFWVVASGTAYTDVRWVTTLSTSESPVSPGFSIGDLTWTSLNDGGSWGNTNVVVRFSVEATSVPEPSTLTLAALGLLGLAMFNRRRKR